LPDEAVLLLELQLGERPADLFDPLRRDENGNEVRIGEVAVVVGLLLAAHGVGLPLGVVPEARLLDDLAAAVQDVALAPDLVLDGPLDVSEGVHVLELRAGPEGLLALRPDGDVGVAAEGALLHVAVADLEVHEDVAQAAQVFGGLLGASHVGFAHDLDEGNARAVEVHVAPGVAFVVNELAGILLHVDAGDADPLLFPVEQDVDVPALGQGMGVLGDLVALRQVRVKVVLPGEVPVGVDRAVGGQPHPDRELHDLPVQHGEDARHPKADLAGMLVGPGPEPGGAAAEDLRGGQELGVHLQPDDGFVSHQSFGLLRSIPECRS